MLALTGFNPVTSQGTHRFIKSDDLKAAVWLGAVDDLWELGKPTGKGGPWKNTNIKAGEWSDPYLMTGYDKRSLSLSHNADNAVTFELQIDLTGTGMWRTFKEFKLSKGASSEYWFPTAFQAYWARIRTDCNCQATAQFNYD